VDIIGMPEKFDISLESLEKLLVVLFHRLK